MRVRISYGVDIEKVPEKVQDLAETSIEKIRESTRLIERICRDLESFEENSEQILKTIDKTRTALSEADLMIADAQSIAIALNNYYNGEQDVSDGRPIVDPSGDPITQTEGPGEG